MQWGGCTRHAGAKGGHAFLATLVSVPIFFRCAASSEVSSVLTYLQAYRAATSNGTLKLTPGSQCL